MGSKGNRLLQTRHTGRSKVWFTRGDTSTTESGTVLSRNNALTVLYTPRGALLGGRVIFHFLRYRLPIEGREVRMYARNPMHLFLLTVAVVALSMGGCPGPTPVTEQAATPVFIPNGGTFTSSVSVTITCATDGASIFYTSDGTNPSDTNGTAYTSAITLTTTTTLKAIAYASGFDPSDIASATFTINKPENVAPVVSNASITGTLLVGQASAATASVTGYRFGWHRRYGHRGPLRPRRRQ